MRLSTDIDRKVCLPGKSQDEFTARWASPNMDRPMLEATVARWRGFGSRR